MAKKKKHEEPNEFGQQVASEPEAEFIAKMPASLESDVKRPELKGKQKPKFEQPGTNNIKSEDIGSKSETE